MTFWTLWSKVLFPKRSAKMIDGSEKRSLSWLLNFWIRMFVKSAVKYFNNNDMKYLPIHRCCMVTVNIYCCNFCPLPWTAFCISLDEKVDLMIFASKTNLRQIWVQICPLPKVRQIPYHICLEEMWDKCDANLSLYLPLLKGILKQDKYDENNFLTFRPSTIAI